MLHFAEWLVSAGLILWVGCLAIETVFNGF